MKSKTLTKMEENFKKKKKPNSSSGTDDDVMGDMEITIRNDEKEFRRWKDLCEQLSKTKNTLNTELAGYSLDYIKQRYEDLCEQLSKIYTEETAPNYDEMQNGEHRVLFAECDAFYRCKQILEANERYYAEKKVRDKEEAKLKKEKKKENGKTENAFPLKPDEVEEIEWLDK